MRALRKVCRELLAWRQVKLSLTAGSETQPTLSGPEPDILFSQLANAEQYEIAARLTQAKAVLVQGPPGTGKTHTIANLLGYLLAQGKTVLVTAHTTKALRVLRRQVDEALQPLCLSVLEETPTVRRSFPALHKILLTDYRVQTLRVFVARLGSSVRNAARC